MSKLLSTQSFAARARSLARAEGQVRRDAEARDDAVAGLEGHGPEPARRRGDAEEERRDGARVPPPVDRARDERVAAGVPAVAQAQGLLDELRRRRRAREDEVVERRGDVRVVEQAVAEQPGDERRRDGQVRARGGDGGLARPHHEGPRLGGQRSRLRRARALDLRVDVRERVHSSEEVAVRERAALEARHAQAAPRAARFFDGRRRAAEAPGAEEGRRERVVAAEQHGAKRRARGPQAVGRRVIRQLLARCDEGELPAALLRRGAREGLVRPGARGPPRVAVALPREARGGRAAADAVREALGAAGLLREVDARLVDGDDALVMGEVQDERIIIEGPRQMLEVAAAQQLRDGLDAVERQRVAARDEGEE